MAQTQAQSQKSTRSQYCCDDPDENIAAQPEQPELNQQQLATFCKALGHPARVKILQILIDRGTCICGEIVEVMPLSQSTVSEHLRILKQAGLVKGEIDGPRVCYCVDPQILQQFKQLVTLL
jgi:ArsR family transcriptional regulator